nr:hypothetical protein BN993_01538 [Virgibacillus halodenitrificans]
MPQELQALPPPIQIGHLKQNQSQKQPTQHKKELYRFLYN